MTRHKIKNLRLGRGPAPLHTDRRNDPTARLAERSFRDNDRDIYHRGGEGVAVIGSKQVGTAVVPLLQLL